MKRVLFGRHIASAVLFAATLSAADAADMPMKSSPPPMPECAWCGGYIGFNAGFFGPSGTDINSTGTDTGASGLGSMVAAGAIATTFGDNYPGFVGGGQIGYNWQFFRDYIFGLEADFDAIGAGRSVSSAPNTVAPFPAVSNKFEHDADWISTYRARLGASVIYNKALVYTTFGLAVAKVGLSDQFICPACTPPSSSEPGTSASSSFTRLGGTAGFGVEWLLGQHVSMRAEYLLADFSSSSTTINYNYPGGTSSLTSISRNTFSIVRLGLNWLF